MGISITSGMAAQITTVIYCVYASKISNLVSVYIGHIHCILIYLYFNQNIVF